MSAQHAQGAADAVGADLGSMSGSAVIHEGHVRAGAEEGFPQLIRRADEHGETTFVHLLNIGYRAVFGIVGGIVQFPGFAGGQILFHGPEHATFEFRSIQGGFPELGVMGGSRVAADHVEGDRIHNQG
jgi:hypothetical protein